MIEILKETVKCILKLFFLFLHYSYYLFLPFFLEIIHIIFQILQLISTEITIPYHIIFNPPLHRLKRLITSHLNRILFKSEPLFNSHTTKFYTLFLYCNFNFHKY